MPLADGRIYVWGSFTSIGGQARPGLARLLANGALDPSFSPDSSLAPIVRIAPAPDGRVYFQTGADSYYIGDGGPITFDTTTVRLATDGSRDTAFAPLVGYRLVGVDSQGRVLAVTVNTSPKNLVRLLPNGTLDPSYTVTLVNASYGATQGNDDLAVSRLTNAGLYAASDSHSRFFTSFTFIRFKPDGGRDSAYQSPPPISSSNSGANANQFSFAYGPDGSLWIARGGDQVFANGNFANIARIESYNASGTANPSQYATRPDLALFRILAVAPDGALLGTTINNNANVAAFFRIRPLTGHVGRLTNLSVRAFVTSANDPLIAGFVTSGTDTTRAIVRAIGPGLVQFGVSDAMTDPRLALTRDGAAAATNDDWPTALAPRFTSVGAFPLTVGSKDAALESSVTVGSYTAVITPAPGDSGTSLVELYESADNPPAPRRFINVSERGPVASARPLIVGFSVTGDVPVTVLVRSAGPALTQFGVTGALADPQLALFRAGTRLWENDNWAPNNTDFRAIGDAATRNGAFAFTPNSNDAAMLVTLAPGNYTAVVTGANNSSGVSLVEVYEAP